MTCPTCGGTARHGKVALQLSGWGEIGSWVDVFSGGSQEHLFHHCYFEPEGGGETVKVLPVGESRDGLLCEQCGTVIIVGKQSRA